MLKPSYLPRGRPSQCGETSQERRLSGAVGPGNRDGFPLRDLQIQLIEDRVIAKILRQSHCTYRHRSMIGH